MDQEIVNKLSLIRNKYKDYIIDVYLAGSSLLDYIINKHDIDIVVIFPTSEAKGEFLRNMTKDNEYKELRLYLKDNFGCSLLHKTIESFKRPEIWSYLEYLYHNKMKIFTDFPENAIEEINVLTHKDEYIELARKTVGYCDKDAKRLYHVLTVKYFIENNSYNLTQEQINNIVMMHDALPETAEQRDVLYNEILDWLGNETV